MAAAEAGKAIFCEKPIALTLEDTDQMIATIKKNGVMFQAGFMRRFDSGYVRFGHAYLAQTEDFVERVLNDKEPAVDGYDARAALVISLAARQSYFEARPVELVEYS